MLAPALLALLCVAGASPADAPASPSTQRDDAKKGADTDDADDTP